MPSDCCSTATDSCAQEVDEEESPMLPDESNVGVPP